MRWLLACIASQLQHHNSYSTGTRCAVSAAQGAHGSGLAPATSCCAAHQPPGYGTTQYAHQADNKLAVVAAHSPSALAISAPPDLLRALILIMIEMATAVASAATTPLMHCPCHPK